MSEIMQCVFERREPVRNVTALALMQYVCEEFPRSRACGGRLPSAAHREPGEHTQSSIRMAYSLASVAFRRALAVSGVAGVLRRPHEARLRVRAHAGS